MKLVVDRIEVGTVVCAQENSQIIEIPLKDIPFIPKEGDSIKFSIGETNKKKKHIEELTKDL